MKRMFLLTIVLLALSLQAIAQDSSAVKTVTYKTKIKGVTSTTGYLSAFSDSSLFVSPVEISFSPFSKQTFGDRIEFQNLREVSLKRKGSTVRGLLTGAVSGAVFGVILGFADGSDYKKNTGSWCLFCMTAGQKAAAGGVVFGGLGGITGTIIGAVSKKKFVIAGKKDRFDAMRNRIVSKTVKHVKN